MEGRAELHSMLERVMGGAELTLLFKVRLSARRSFHEYCVIEPCELMGFGDIHGPKPYELIGFGDLHGTKPYKFIWFGDIHGPKP